MSVSEVELQYSATSVGPRRFLLRLLVVAWLVVDFHLISLHRPLIEREYISDVVGEVTLWGALFGQFATLAGWLALGDGSWILRPALMAFYFAAVQGLVWLFGFRQQEVWLAISSIYMVLVALPLLAMRAAGWRCAAADSQLEEGSQRFQFSILQLLSVTTLVAASLAILQRMKVSLPNNSVVPYAIILLALASIAWLTWLVMLRVKATAGIPLVLIIAPILGFAAGAIRGFAWEAWIGFASLQALVLAANIAVLRVARYELRRDVTARASEAHN